MCNRNTNKELTHLGSQKQDVSNQHMFCVSTPGSLLHKRLHRDPQYSHQNPIWCIHKLGISRSVLGKTDFSFSFQQPLKEGCCEPVVFI